MSIDTKPYSMNEANEWDPFDNNSYGTLLDSGYKMVRLSILDVNDFNERIIRGYDDGISEKVVPADLLVARSLVPAGTATPLVNEQMRRLLVLHKLNGRPLHFPGFRSRSEIIRHSIESWTAYA